MKLDINKPAPSLSSLASSLYNKYPVNAANFSPEAIGSKYDSYYTQLKARVNGITHYLVDNYDALVKLYSGEQHKVWVKGSTEGQGYYIPNITLTKAMLGTLTHTMRIEAKHNRLVHKPKYLQGKKFDMVTWYAEHTACGYAACLIGSHILTGKLFPFMLATLLEEKTFYSTSYKLSPRYKLSSYELLNINSIAEAVVDSMYYAMGNSLSNSTYNFSYVNRNKRITNASLLTDKQLATLPFLNKHNVSAADAYQYLNLLHTKVLAPSNYYKYLFKAGA